MELLTVQETAEMLKVAPATVRRYIASGRLAAVRVGREVRVRKEVAESMTNQAKVNGDKTRRLPRPSRVFTFDDPLWNIAGIGTSDGPADVSSNKHKYLADAYADLHDKPRNG